MSDSTDYAREIFSHLGPISTFGGYRVYCGDIMSALVHKDCLYLKADCRCSYHFEKEGLNQFQYNKSGKKNKNVVLPGPR